MNRSKAALLLVCLLCMLLLASCHTNTDPWPAGSVATNAPQAVTEGQSAPTAAPGQSDPSQSVTAPEATLEVTTPDFNG